MNIYLRFTKGRLGGDTVNYHVLAFLFLPLAFSSLPAVLPFVSPSSQVEDHNFCMTLPGTSEFRTAPGMGLADARVVDTKSILTTS